MRSFNGIKVLAATALLSATLLGGCVVAPAPGYYGGGVVTIAPPAARVEVVGVAATPGYVWFPGYWNWNGGGHVWVGGYWGPGRPGYYWAPHAWVRYGGGWRMAPGHWVRREQHAAWGAIRAPRAASDMTAPFSDSVPHGQENQAPDPID